MPSDSTDQTQARFQRQCAKQQGTRGKGQQQQPEIGLIARHGEEGDERYHRVEDLVLDLSKAVGGVDRPSEREQGHRHPGEECRLARDRRRREPAPQRDRDQKTHGEADEPQRHRARKGRTNSSSMNGSSVSVRLTASARHGIVQRGLKYGLHAIEHGVAGEPRPRLRGGGRAQARALSRIVAQQADRRGKGLGVPRPHHQGRHASRAASPIAPTPVVTTASPQAMACMIACGTPSFA